MSTCKYFNKRTILLFVPIVFITFIYSELLPDAGGNARCSELLGFDLEKQFGMDFKPQWKIKLSCLTFDIFRYKATWSEYKKLEFFLISEGWHVREGTVGDECMQTAITVNRFNLQGSIIIIEHLDGKRSRQVIYDKDNSMLYFENKLWG